MDHTLTRFIFVERELEREELELDLVIHAARRYSIMHHSTNEHLLNYLFLLLPPPSSYESW